MNEILDLKYEKFVLDNGLEVILYKDNSIPSVAVNLWYKVGSANEKPGKTGLAHLFEHMMFQGSLHVPKEMHFKYIQEAGGTLNGTTNTDRTNYFETLPSPALELALWLESDRMGFLLPALTQEKLDNQREVVMNERLQRYDNQPYGRAWEILFSNLFPENHPYHWPTIGWAEDIKNYTLDDVRSFFETYYAPNNASLVIAGDIDYDKAAKAAEKYFSEIKPYPEIPKVNVPSFELTENKYIVHEDNVRLPRIYLMWKTAPLYKEDDAKLDALSDALSSSKNSRLYKTLIFDKQIALDSFAFQYSGHYEGIFIIVATARPGVSLDELKKLIFAEIEKIFSEGITNAELEKAKNTIISDNIYALQNISGVANQLNNYNCTLGEPNSFIYDINRYEKLTPEDVRKATVKYLSEPYVELRIVPKNGN
jgi:zinc protease